MPWGTLITLFLRALPDLVWLWRRRAEAQTREAIHEDVQNFRQALASGDRDALAVLLERRLREARRVRDGRPPGCARAKGPARAGQRRVDEPGVPERDLRSAGAQGGTERK